MDPFDEWVKTAPYHCIQKWGEKVVALGATWDSFRCKENDDNNDKKQKIINDLVQHGGIPILAAQDIVNIATEEIRKSTAPITIFWDLEKMPIPEAVSGCDMINALKTTLAPYGCSGLTQVRGYVAPSSAMGLQHSSTMIPQEKRSDLQLSGCHLVDCWYPANHNTVNYHDRTGWTGTVIDKMIIVDALNFAHQNPEGAILCFIIDDPVDYAYLLAVLQQRPQWRTIVISRGTMQSKLHVNSHAKICWETDILQNITDSSLHHQPREIEANDEETVGEKDEQISFCAASIELDTEKNDSFIQEEQFPPLTANKFWKDDIELLRNAMAEEGRRSGGGSQMLRKSQLGNILRQTNPTRFPDRESIQNFLSQAIEKGVVTETGEGAFKTLTFAKSCSTQQQQLLLQHQSISTDSSSLPISSELPLKLTDMPTKALEIASKGGLPFILFVRKFYCPSGDAPPEKVFVQSTEEWLLLMYATESHVAQTFARHDWLRKGILVDWRKVVGTSAVAVVNAGVSSSSSSFCPLCNAQCSAQDLATYSYKGNQFCSDECMKWSMSDQSIKDQAVALTVETLKFVAENDDVYVPQKMFAKTISLRHPKECIDRKYGRLWVKEAIRTGKILEIKRSENKTKLICLPEYRKQALEEFLRPDDSTAVEEKFVHDLLWEEGQIGGLDRRYVAKKLALKFGDRMDTPLRRNRVLLNGQTKGKMHLSKGPFLHMIGLTKEQAEAAMEFLMNHQSSVVSPSAVPNDADVEDHVVLDTTMNQQADEGNSSSPICPRRIVGVKTSSASALAYSSSSEVLFCPLCNAQCSAQDLATYSYKGNQFCSDECMKWSISDQSTKDQAVALTVETLKFMAENDDVYAPQSILAKTVSLRHPKECIDRKYGRLWVKEAIRTGKILEIKRSETKAKLVCLPEYRKQALEEFLRPDDSTAVEEKFVHDLLWEEGQIGGLDRRYVAKKLALKFGDRMDTPLRRNRVLLNGQTKGKMHLSKGPFLHMIGLTKEQAEASIETCMEQSQSIVSPLTADDVADVEDHVVLDTALKQQADEGDSSAFMVRTENNDNDEQLDCRSILSTRSASSSELDLNGVLPKEKTPPSLLLSGNELHSADSSSSAANSVASMSNTTFQLVKEKTKKLHVQQQGKTASQIVLPHIDENGNYASKNLHVSGFGDGTTKQEMYHFFRRYDPVLEVIPKVAGMHQFMFVNMSSKETAIRARQDKHGKELNGGRLKINFAK